MKQIPITKPFFDADEFALITKPLETGWVVQGLMSGILRRP